MSEGADPEAQRNAVVAGWYVQFSRRVYNLAFKACRGDHYAADDIVHETFAAVIKQFDSAFKGKPRPQVEAMLFTIARRRAIDHFRKINKVSLSGDVGDLDFDCVPGSEDPVVRVIDREGAERLWQVLKRHLTPMEHAVALLSWDWCWARCHHCPSVGDSDGGDRAVSPQPREIQSSAPCRAQHRLPGRTTRRDHGRWGGGNSMTPARDPSRPRHSGGVDEELVGGDDTRVAWLTHEAYVGLKQEFDELIAHRHQLAAEINALLEGHDSRDAAGYLAVCEEQDREQTRIRHLKVLLRSAQVADSRPDSGGKAPTVQNEDGTYVPAANEVYADEAPDDGSPQPATGNAVDANEGELQSEVLHEVTIYDAFRGLDDYLAGQESVFDVSAGLARLFAGTDHTLLGLQSVLASADPAPDAEPRSPLPISTPDRSTDTRAAARARMIGETPAIGDGRTMVRTRRTGRIQQERSAALRRRLLDATIYCLVRYGYAGTTTTRVTELAGVTRGAQVYHFPTRADLIAAAMRHLAAKRVELAFEKIDEVRQAPDPLDAALDLLWEVHQGPFNYATIEMWVAARIDPGLREQLTKVEPAVRASLLEFAEAAFGDYAVNPRFRHVMYTVMDTIRGILLMSLSEEESKNTLKRWLRAKAGFLDLANSVLPSLER